LPKNALGTTEIGGPTMNMSAPIGFK